MTAAHDLPPAAAPAGPAAGEHTGDAVIQAARALAEIYTIAPNWRHRGLNPRAVALIDAVHAHDRGRQT